MIGVYVKRSRIPSGYAIVTDASGKVVIDVNGNIVIAKK